MKKLFPVIWLVFTFVLIVGGASEIEASQGDNGKEKEQKKAAFLGGKWNVKDVGLVKPVLQSGEMGVSPSLSESEENVPLVQEVRFFYPNIEADGLEYKTKKISFMTNDIMRKKLEEAYKQPVDPSLGKVFSKNTTINSLYLNKDSIVYIDLNQAFMNEMNAGAGYESLILQSVANTFGQYYNVEKVILTIDGDLYESGHISMEKGEYLRVQN
ncbi:GerMN domain-containing protein [Bacillus sp. Hm123]|uniref:GerMN domain-containing protein n=1 Tax=Bacillus sp. Hm123 TaxID=3450745 RepID=UPI003F438D49